MNESHSSFVQQSQCTANGCGVQFIVSFEVLKMQRNKNHKQAIRNLGRILSICVSVFRLFLIRAHVMAIHLNVNILIIARITQAGHPDIFIWTLLMSYVDTLGGGNASGGRGA